jgi:Hint domain
MPKKSMALLALFGALTLACSSGSASNPVPSPTAGKPLAAAEVKYALIERLGARWFCDPDEYPVARADEAQLALQRFGQIKADADSYTTIAAHLGIAGGDPTAAQKLVIYRAWKQLNSITLEPIGNNRFRFDYLAVPAAGKTDGTRSVGIVDDRGLITIEQQAPAGQPPCPICLARGTRIATPSGDVPVEDVRPGMSVWSVDATGRRIVVTVTKVGSVPVPSTHEVVRLVLDDGRIVTASPGHPLPDGRRLGDVRSGDGVDGVTVVSAELLVYTGGSTFDLLPSGPTGVYFADGIPLASTLATR